jgi:hypothetical protein
MPTISPDSARCTESHRCSRLEPCSSHLRHPGYLASSMLTEPALPYPVQPGATSRSNPILPSNLTRILGLPFLSLACTRVDAHGHVYSVLHAPVSRAAWIHACSLPSRPELWCHQPLILERWVWPTIHIDFSTQLLLTNLPRSPHLTISVTPVFPARSIRHLLRSERLLFSSYRRHSCCFLHTINAGFLLFLQLGLLIRVLKTRIVIIFEV